MNRVYVILVNWNGWRDTIECLESVFRCDCPEFRVIICDNGSSDNSLERIKAWAVGGLSATVPTDNPLHTLSYPPCGKPLEFAEYQRESAECGGDLSIDPHLIMIRIGVNLGFAGGNNIGIRYALSRGDFSHVWLLNNDTVISPDALTAMVRRMEEKTGSGMCGSTIRSYAQPERILALGGGCHCKWIGLPWHYGKYFSIRGALVPEEIEKRMNYVEGCSLLVSKSFLGEVGLMCEDYFLYFEETDWAIRAKGRFSLACAPDSIIYHKVGGSIGTSSKPWEKSYLCDYFSIRNRLLFTRRFYVYALPTVYVTVIVALFARMLLGKWDRVKMIFSILSGNFGLLSDRALPDNITDRDRS